MLWLVLITYLSNKRPSELPKLDLFNFPNSDKVVHFIFYFVLALLCAWGFKKQSAFSFMNRRFLIKAFVFAILWGGFVEILQLTIFTYRSAEWLDFGANTFGALIGVSLFLIFDKKLMADSR